MKKNDLFRSFVLIMACAISLSCDKGQPDDSNIPENGDAGNTEVPLPPDEGDDAGDSEDPVDPEVPAQTPWSMRWSIRMSDMCMV